MQLAQEKHTGGYMIKQYAPGEIHVGNEVYTQSIILSEHEVLTWAVEAFHEINNETLTPLLTLNPEIIILGTGVTQQFLSSEVMAQIIERKIGCEIMDTHAACRTYNLLASEGRNIVAGLLIK